VDFAGSSLAEDGILLRCSEVGWPTCFSCWFPGRKPSDPYGSFAVTSMLTFIRSSRWPWKLSDSLDYYGAEKEWPTPFGWWFCRPFRWLNCTVKNALGLNLPNHQACVNKKCFPGMISVYSDNLAYSSIHESPHNGKVLNGGCSSFVFPKAWRYCQRGQDPKWLLACVASGGCCYLVNIERPSGIGWVLTWVVAVACLEFYSSVSHSMIVYIYIYV